MKHFICAAFGHQARGPVPIEFQFIDDYTFYRCKRCRRLIYFIPRKGWKVWKIVDVRESQEHLIQFVEEKLGPIKYRSDFKVFSNGDVEGWFCVGEYWHFVQEHKNVFSVDGAVWRR